VDLDTLRTLALPCSRIAERNHHAADSCPRSSSRVALRGCIACASTSARLRLQLARRLRRETIRSGIRSGN
jgi:hypothetical protein